MEKEIFPVTPHHSQMNIIAVYNYNVYVLSSGNATFFKLLRKDVWMIPYYHILKELINSNMICHTVHIDNNFHV